MFESCRRKDALLSQVESQIQPPGLSADESSMNVGYKIETSEFELFNAVPSPIVVTEVNGAIIFANAEFEDLVNIEGNIIEGMCIENLFPAQQKKQIAATLSIANKQPGNFRLKQQTLFIRRKSRRQVMVDVSLSKYEMSQRNVVVFSFSDLSEFQLKENYTSR